MGYLFAKPAFIGDVDHKAGPIFDKLSEKPWKNALPAYYHAEFDPIQLKYSKLLPRQVPTSVTLHSDKIRPRNFIRIRNILPKRNEVSFKILAYDRTLW